MIDGPDLFSDAVAQLLQASEMKESAHRRRAAAAAAAAAATAAASAGSSSSDSSRSPSPVPGGGEDGEGRRPHSCHFTNCSRSFGRLEHLKRHIRSHTGERPFECTFDGCLKRFSRYDNMLQHARCHTERYVRRRKRGGVSSSSSSPTPIASKAELASKVRRSLNVSETSSVSSASSSPLSPPSNVLGHHHTMPMDQFNHKMLKESAALHHSLQLPSLRNVDKMVSRTMPPLLPPLPTSSQQSQATAQAGTSSVDAYFLERIRAANTLASFQFTSSPPPKKEYVGDFAILSS